MKITNKNKSFNKSSFDGIETYEKRVKRVYEGREDLPVIQQGSEAWDNWMRYFEHIGHNHAKPNSFARLRGRITVPELDPERFDPGFHCSNSNQS